MTKSRKIWLDVVRATAILCVVLCHSVEAFYHPVLLGQLQVSFPLWNIENLLFTIGRIGVPLFLATTGALMLPRDYPDVSAFIRNHCSHYSLLRKYGFFQLHFCCVIEHQTFNISRLLLEMLFLKSSSLSHMWYMPVILGCYIALPFLSRLLQTSTNLRQYSLLYVLGIIIFL
ncbi:MAG: acyltransferase family protein [Blautia sp.]